MKTPQTILNISLYLCFLVLSLFGSLRVQAQVQKFQKIYGGYAYEQGVDLIQTPDTGYLLLNNSSSYSPSADLYLLKVNKAGIYEWQRTYGRSETEGACKIKITADGNIAMAGYTGSYTDVSYDYYLVKTSALGDTLWSKHYGTSDWDIATSMDTTTDGGFILVGNTYDTGNSYTDIFIVKTDADGNQLWQVKKGGNLNEEAADVLSLNDGYLICGTTESIGNGKKDIYVIRLDLNGNTLWETTLGGAEDDSGESILLNAANNEIVVGANTKSFGNPLINNFFIQKLDLLGNTLPSYFISTSSSDYFLKGLVLRPNGNIVVYGHLDFFGSKDMMLLEYQYNFNYVTGATFGSFFDEVAGAAINTNDGGMCTIGTTNSYTFGLSNIYLIKSDTLITNAGTVQILVDTKEQQVESPISNHIFPNPCQDVFHFVLPQSSIEWNTATIELYAENTTGQRVKLNNIRIQHQKQYTEVIVSQTELKNGIYFLTLYAHNKIQATAKITVLR